MIDFGIIAAGDGNRLVQEGSFLPKPLVRIDGKPMLGRLVNLMEICGAKSVSIILNKDMLDVIHYVEDLGVKSNCEIKIITAKTSSSMHSFYELLKIMQPQDKFIVTTVDTVFQNIDFQNYIKYFENSPKEIDGVMGVTTYIDDEKPLYIEINKQHTIISFKDEKPADVSLENVNLVSAGVYGLRKNAIPVLKECIKTGVNRMRNFQRKLVETGLNLKAYNLGKVLDIDHVSDIEKANAFLV